MEARQATTLQCILRSMHGARVCTFSCVVNALIINIKRKTEKIQKIIVNKLSFNHIGMVLLFWALSIVRSYLYLPIMWDFNYSTNNIRYNLKYKRNITTNMSTTNSKFIVLISLSQL